MDHFVEVVQKTHSSPCVGRAPRMGIEYGTLYNFSDGLRTRRVRTFQGNNRNMYVCTTPQVFGSIFDQVTFLPAQQAVKGTTTQEGGKEGRRAAM